MPKDNPSVGRRFFRMLLSTLSHIQIAISTRVGSALIVFLLLSSTLTGVIAGFTTLTSTAAANTTVNFQARILQSSGALVPDGNYHLEFKIYDTVSTGATAQGVCSGNCLWVETRTTGNLVRVVNGYVSVYLGDVTAFPSTMPWGDNLYVTMRVGGIGGSPSWDTEMVNATTGRMKLSAVPYAFTASNLATSATNTASTNSSNISIQTGNATGATSNSGNITIDSGTATGTTGAVLLGTNNASGLTFGNTTYNPNSTFQGTGLLTINGGLQVDGNTTLGSNTSDTLTVEADATFNGSLIVSAGDQFTNSGSTLFTAIALSDDSNGGVLGSTAAATVDVATTININQTTAAQTFTLATPTDTTAGRIVFVNNIGSTSLVLEGNTISTGKSVSFIWNGSAWVQTISFVNTSVDTVGAIDSQTKSANGAVISGTTIYLQNADIDDVGLVSIGAQTFNGIKTFDDGIVVTAGGATITAGALAVNSGSITSSAATLVINAAGAVDIQDNVTVDSLTVDTGDVAITSGALSTAGTVRLTNGGALSNITGYSQTSGNFAITGSGTFSTGTGTVDLNGATSITGTNTFTVGTGATVLGGNLTVDTNTLFVNSASDFVNIGSTTDELAKFAIIGSADEEQLLIRAAAGQTVANPLVLLQNSSSAELARINASTTSLYFGNAAGGNSAGGNNNTGIGASALGSVLTGTGNTTLGSGALASVSVNNNNTAVGYNAGNLATGGNNIFLGALAGDNVTTGTDNIIIGYNLDASAAGVSNELRIGGVLQGNTSTLAAQFNGTLAVTTLGSADTSTFLCRNTSNQLATCSSTPLTNSLTDNIADAFDLQEGTNNYININTTNGSEAISFGNTTTNPDYNFLGSGTTTFNGNVDILSGRLYVEQSGASWVDIYDESGGGGNDVALNIRSDAAGALNIGPAAGGTAFSVSGGSGDVFVGGTLQGMSSATFGEASTTNGTLTLLRLY